MITFIINSPKLLCQRDNWLIYFLFILSIVWNKRLSSLNDFQQKWKMKRSFNPLYIKRLKLLYLMIHENRTRPQNIAGFLTKFELESKNHKYIFKVYLFFYFLLAVTFSNVCKLLCSPVLPYPSFLYS